MTDAEVLRATLPRAVLAQTVAEALGFARGEPLAALAAALALRGEHDWLVPQQHEIVPLLAHGVALEALLLLHLGDPAGGWWPGARVLPYQASPGAQLAHAAGLAGALAYREKRAVVLAFADGDALAQLDADEAMRAAHALRCPLVVLVTSTGAAPDDVCAVYRAVAEAAERARAGGGPALLRASADASPREALAALAARARAAGAWSGADERDARAAARRRVDDALARARAAFRPGALQLAEYLYYSLPRRLAAQLAPAAAADGGAR